MVLDVSLLYKVRIKNDLKRKKTLNSNQQDSAKKELCHALLLVEELGKFTPTH